MGLISKFFEDIKKNQRAANERVLKTDPTLKKLNKDLEDSYEALRVRDEKSKKRQAEWVKKKAEEEDKRQKHINKEYEGEIAEKILKNELFIDMTKQMLVDAWGEPDDKKETVFKNKVKLKYLYDKTGVGMMDCKRALVDTNGDLEKAVEALQKAGVAKAENKTQVNLENDLVVGWRDL